MSKNLLMILDGWGIGPNEQLSAIAQAKTPFIDHIYKEYPHAKLITHGEKVGLPKKQMGNSEVGHLTIGSGRVIYQELLRINKAIENGHFFDNTVLNHTLSWAKEQNKSLHLMGLLSDGGIHAHINHLKAICTHTQTKKIQNVYIHIFTDGRDTPPKSAHKYIEDLKKHIHSFKHIKIASLIGRYYAMDRDKRWDRIKKAYDLLTKGKGEKTTDILESISDQYAKNISDEFMPPIVSVDDKGIPIATIQPHDVVICFNFRTDRCREITQALTQKDFPAQHMQVIPHLHYTTMTNYNDQFKNIQVIFNKRPIHMCLGEVLEKYRKHQVRIAETEKYPHVTFFFNGGREKPFNLEERQMIASPKVATYDLQPEMSALEITQTAIKHIKKQKAEFICLNYANPDMVGHTGNMKACIKAVEFVDSCVEKVVNVCLENNYSIIIIADHGNADQMKYTNGKPHTAHTTNLVPFIAIEKNIKEVKNGSLCDIAPTILDIMKLPKPKEMTGNSLIVKS